MIESNKRLVWKMFSTVGPLFLILLLSSPRVEGQVSCNQVGNHLIKVAKAQGSDQLVDCESARISKKANHKVTWQASGNDTLTIDFGNNSPFLKFACQNKKSCTGTIDPSKPLQAYKYTVTLKTGAGTFVEDPDVVIQD